MNMESWIKYNKVLRKKVTKKENNENQFLLASFVGTEQQKDIEARTPLIGDYFRAKINVKAFDDAERAKKGLKPFDFSDNSAVLKALGDEFDMPYWAFVRLGKAVPLKDLRKTFIYQLVSCNYSCPWCYVDDINKRPSAFGAKFISTKKVVDAFEQEKANQPIYNIRPSGGEPTLMIEQWIEVLRDTEKRKLTAYMQGDTNLSTGHFLDELERTAEIEPHLLEKVAEFENAGVLCSFKGTDRESFLTAAGFIKKDSKGRAIVDSFGRFVPDDRFSFLEPERFYTFKKMLTAGLDAYPFVYDPNPNTLEAFMERGAKEFGEGFYLKTWVLPIKLYGPEKVRLIALGVDPVQYQKQLDVNFARSKEVMQEIIWKKFGINYQAVPRTGVRLESKIK
jgi:organic radical activating enzyme